MYKKFKEMFISCMYKYIQQFFLQGRIKMYEDRIFEFFFVLKSKLSHRQLTDFYNKGMMFRYLKYCLDKLILI